MSACSSMVVAPKKEENFDTWDRFLAEIKPLSEECRKAHLVNLWLVLAYESHQKHEYTDEKYYLCYSKGFDSMSPMLINSLSEGTGKDFNDILDTTHQICYDFFSTNDKMWSFFPIEADNYLKPYVKKYLHECFDTEQHEYLNKVLETNKSTD